MLATMNLFPWLRRRSIRAASADVQTRAVVDAANALRRQADDVIRAAYQLADARMRERDSSK